MAWCAAQWQQALRLWSGMVGIRIDPDVTGYGAVISACEKGGQWLLALAQLREMHQQRAKVDVISYSAAVSACEKGRQWLLALAQLREMHQHLVPQGCPDLLVAEHASCGFPCLGMLLRVRR